jgi:hypothetical protein
MNEWMNEWMNDSCMGIIKQDLQKQIAHVILNLNQ